MARHASVTGHNELVSEMLTRETDPKVREMMQDILEPLADELPE